MSEIQLRELVFGKEIGRGSFGFVCKGTYKGDVVAIKTVEGTTEKKDIEREVFYLAMVDHRNIIKLKGIATDNIKTYLVMEYAEGGSLWSFLHESETPYTLAQGKSWLRQAAEGLAYLHQLTQRSVIHRDVKPLNMLLDGTRSTLKLCDFGFVRNVQTQMTSRLGTCLYMAPEVFNGQRYTEKCDVYSMGITIWEVLSRKIPYYEQHGHKPVKLLGQIDDHGLRPSLKDLIFACPEQIQTLMQECWDKNPEKRPSMQGIVEILKQF